MLYFNKFVYFMVRLIGMNIRLLKNILKLLKYIFKLFKSTFLKKNYSLNSGERQTATFLAGIRKDHINRYSFAVSAIKNYCGTSHMLRGLDIFCGNGYGSKYIADNINVNLTSIDGSKEAIKCAKEYYYHENIKFMSKLFPFKLEKNFYDFVVSLESIEHIKNDVLFFKTLHKSLKNDGLLVISTPNNEKYNLQINPIVFHFRHYINADFINLAKNIGFDLIAMYGQDIYKCDEKGVKKGLLQESEMDLKKDYNGQFSIFVFKKKQTIKKSFKIKNKKRKTLFNNPYSIIIDTTILCNSNCSFCWRSHKPAYLKEIKKKYSNNHTMDFYTFKKIVDDIVQYDGVEKIALCGPMGEPLLNPNIADFYEYARNKNYFKKLVVNTNGFFLDRHNISKLMNNMTEISISIDSIDPLTYEKIHGNREFLSKVIENVKKLIEYKREHGALAKVTVRFTENEYNTGQFEEFKKFFFELGVNEINYTQLHGFAGVYKERKNDNNIKMCNQKLKSINFNFKGDMTTCCVNWHLEPTFGNIHEQSIKEMWNNKKMQNWLKNDLTTEPCKDCSGVGLHVQYTTRFVNYNSFS